MLPRLVLSNASQIEGTQAEIIFMIDFRAGVDEELRRHHTAVESSDRQRRVPVIVSDGHRVRQQLKQPPHHVEVVVDGRFEEAGVVVWSLEQDVGVHLREAVLVGSGEMSRLHVQMLGGRHFEVELKLKLPPVVGPLAEVNVPLAL